MPGTLNMWNNINDHIAMPVDDPNYIDLAVGYAYSFTIANTTGTDITSGTLELWNADAKPDNPCEPDVWEPMEPVAGCAPIVSGIPEIGPVTIDLSVKNIPAHSICVFSAPCPKQFFQIRGTPPGCLAIATVSSLRRTDFTHLGPLGYVPQPLPTPFGIGFSAPVTQQAPAQTPPQPQPRAQLRSPPPAVPPPPPRRQTQPAE